jgi:hypothetical protein
VIFAFSTSSPVASVAVLSTEGEVLFAGQEVSNMKASEVCFRLLAESGFDPNQGTIFLSDIGPGSFTGTRVGVTIAKTLAFVAKAQCGGANAFDLISLDQTVVMPSKKGEWFIRHPGQLPYRDAFLPVEPYVGFGGEISEPAYPIAERFVSLLKTLELESAEAFVPKYLIEPSISIQKKGFGLAGAPK